MGCLAGCDMSAEDLAKWEKKADGVIEKLTETNNLLEQQIVPLSKQEACDMVLNSYNKFIFGFVDKVRVTTIDNKYHGYFDNLREESKFVYNFQFKDNVQYAQGEGYNPQGEIDAITYIIADFEEDKYYVNHYFGQEEVLEECDDKLVQSSIAWLVSEWFDCSVINKDNIIGYAVNSDGACEITAQVSECLLVKVVIKNGLMIEYAEYEYKDISAEQGEQTEGMAYIQSREFKVQFDYDCEMDFSVVEAKHQQLLESTN